MKLTDPQRLVEDNALYMGDNGRLFCGRHAGASAAYTLRDISGQKIIRVYSDPSNFVTAEFLSLGLVPKCESCGRPA